MGEIADMVLDGTLCQECGGLVYGEGDPNEALEEEVSPGYPRTCYDCICEAKGMKDEN